MNHIETREKTGATRPTMPCIVPFRLMFALIVVAVMASGCSSVPTASSPDGGDHEVAGLASWYGEQFHGNQTASGEIYDMHQHTAAHRTLPFGTVVRVRVVENRKSVVVRINDRGPFVSGRVIDLSYAAARDLGMVQAGVAEVELEVVNW